jgi:hypothetical protein
VTLPDHANGVFLEWWDWNGAEASDCIRVLVDGTEVYGLCDYDQRQWTHHVVDLSVWAGQTVDLEFELEVCCAPPGPDGWYIDDVSIYVPCVSDIDVDALAVEALVCTDHTETVEFSICNSDSLPLKWQLGELVPPASRAGTPPVTSDRKQIPGSSTAAPEGYVPTLSRSHSPGAQPLAGTVAIFKDLDPWGVTEVEGFLAANGIPYEVHTSAEFGSLNFGAYGMIVFSGDQPQSFYDAYASHLAKFEAYVETGGFLNFFAADFGNNSGILTAPLPGGMTWWTGVLENYNVIDDPTHPVVQGVPDPFWGNLASHGHFGDLPANAHVIASEQSGAQPTIVEVPLGGGKLMAFGQPLEISRFLGWDAGAIMENTLLWGHNWVPQAVPWLSEDPITGVVLPGDCTDVEVTFDAIGMPVDEYYAELVIWSNDRDTPVIHLPVTMTVLASTGIDAVTWAADECSVSFSSTAHGGGSLSCNWDFGDGIGTSTAANPTYVYDLPGGCFDVTLEVSNDCSSDSWTDQVCVSCPARVYLPIVLRDLP